MTDNTKKSKKQFYKSNFYFYSKEIINIDDFDKDFKETYTGLKFKFKFRPLVVQNGLSNCEKDDSKIIYSLYLNERCDKDMFNNIVSFILNKLTTKVNIYYKHIDENDDKTKKYDYSFVAIRAEPKKYTKMLFIDDE